MMDIHEILKKHPHRYPLLLVDRVLEIEKGKRIQAIKNVSINEPYFVGHFPHRPVMPGVLMLEAMAQAATLLALAEGRPLEPLLRAFEWRLLDDLGYGFELNNDLHGEPIAADGMYRLQVDAGLERVYLLQPGLFQGTELLAMSEADWSAPGALSAAKRLMRQALAVHLGGRPLVSRELFRKP